MTRAYPLVVLWGALHNWSAVETRSLIKRAGDDNAPDTAVTSRAKGGWWTLADLTDTDKLWRLAAEAREHGDKASEVAIEARLQELETPNVIVLRPLGPESEGAGAGIAWTSPLGEVPRIRYRAVVDGRATYELDATDAGIAAVKATVRHREATGTDARSVSAFPLDPHKHQGPNPTNRNRNRGIDAMRFSTRILMLTFGVALAAVFAAGCGGENARGNGSGAVSPPPSVDGAPGTDGTAAIEDAPRDEPEITLSEYDRIERGMTYEEVAAIVGTPGEVTSEFKATPVPGVEDMSSKSYAWKGRSAGSSAMITFVGGKVETTMQFGLD